MNNKIIETDRIMGGEFLVQTWASDDQSIRETIRKGFRLIHQLEDKLTDFKDSSFNMINKMAGKDWVQVDEETYQLIKKSIEISELTGGAFDISYASVGQLWREARKNGVIPSSDEIQRRLPFVDYRLIELADEELKVFLPSDQMRIGLGGIGKGYAVDKLYDYLLNSGLVNFLVSGSGDIRVHSAKNALRPWRLAIKNPFSEVDKVIGYVEVQDGSLATSGDYINFVKAKHRQEKLHHILETRTGTPAIDISSCTILANQAIVADTMATSVMAMKSERGLKFLNRENLFGIIIRSNGEVLLSRKAMSHFGNQAQRKRT